MTTYAMNQRKIMSTAEKIFEEVQALPEPQARAVLEFVSHLKAQRSADCEARRAVALQTLAKYRGRFDPVKFNRDELHDRESLR
jgi:hypothetical protein